VKLTTHLHGGSNLRTSGAMPSLPLYAFMAWKGTTLRLIIISIVFWKPMCVCVCVCVCVKLITYLHLMLRL
jgi:hypothetical protein